LSSNEKREVIAIPLESLIAELSEVRKYIDALQAQINQLTVELNEIGNSRNFISEIKSGAREIIVPTDRRGYVLTKARLEFTDKVIVHVGLDYYVEVPLEKAMDVLVNIEKDLRDTINTLQRELNNATIYYQQLQSIVNKALEQARTQVARKT